MNPVRNLAKNNWHVYVIESLKDKFWYTGCTDNLINGMGTRYLKNRLECYYGIKKI